MNGEYRIIIDGVPYNVSVARAETYIPPLAAVVSAALPAPWVTAQRIAHLPAR